MLFEDRLDSSQESVNGSCVLRHGHVGAIRTSDCANSLFRNDAQQFQPLTVAPNPQTHLMRAHSSLSGHHWDSKSERKASSVRNTLTRTRQCLRQQERCLNSDYGTTRSLLFRGFFRKPVVARFDQREGNSDGGALPLKAADRHYGLVAGLASCLRDEPQAVKVDHSLRESVA
jgi:hypothetical protein